jgi:hypothetical protein
MSVTTQVSNVVVEPVDAVIGNQHLVCFDTVAGTGLGADHFLVSSKTVDYYVWFNTGASIDPAPAGKTSLVAAGVSVLVGDTAAQIAVKTAAAINAVATPPMHAKAVTNQGKLLVEVKGLGAPLSAFAAGTSGFTVTILKAGSELPLGYLDGNVEFGLAETLFDIVSHQTGSEVIGKIRTGSELGPITLTLKETVAAKLKELLEIPGTAYTPGAGTEVSGLGALAGSKQFSNAFTDTRMLVLHPTKNLATNLANDFCFWASYPNISNLVISGEEDRKVELEVSIFLDENRVNEVSKLVYGDWQQNFLKG